MKEFYPQICRYQGGNHLPDTVKPLVGIVGKAIIGVYDVRLDPAAVRRLIGIVPQEIAQRNGRRFT